MSFLLLGQDAPEAVTAAAEAAGHGGSADFPILTALVLLPILGALIIAITPRSRPELIKLTAIATTVGTAALSIWLLMEFDKHDPEYQFRSLHEWIPSLGISWNLGVDGISLFMVVLTGTLFPLAVLAVSPHHDEKSYFGWMLFLMGGVMGVFVSIDLFLFFVFFEITLVPMYFLIGGWGYANRVYAATKFFLYTMLGSAFMLVAIVSLVWLNAAETGVTTFDLEVLANSQAIATETARLLFLCFLAAFAVKIPMFPVHTWLPDAHTEAPTAGSVILAGVLLKLGSYGLLRFGFNLFPEAVVWARPLLLTLGVIGIIYGAVVATMQTDLKRLVAYSSVAHMGFIVIGLAALNTEGIDGSVIQMVNHGVSTGALFLLVGMIYERRHTREIAALSGLQKSAPVLAGVFMLVMLSSVGLPGLNGFVGEFLILQGTFLSARWWGVVAAAGVILAAIYLLWAYQRVFHGAPEGDNASVPDIKLREFLVMVPFLLVIVGMGLYPKPVLERISPSVELLLAHVDEQVDDFTPASPLGPDVAVDDEQLEEIMRELEVESHEGAGGEAEAGEAEADEAEADEEAPAGVGGAGQ